MSYPITETVGLVPTIAVAASYTPDLSSLPTTTNDDCVILCVSCYAASGTLSISGTGWVEQIELDVSNGCRMAVYYCKVESGAVATPTISLSSGTGSWQCAAWVERDAPAAGPFDGSVSVDSGTNVTSLNSASYTPGTDNCRVLWFATARNSGGTPYVRMLESDSVGECIQAIYNGTDGMAMGIGSAVQDTATSTVKPVYRSSTGRIGIITLGIKNKTGGKRSVSASVGLSRVSLCGIFGDSHDGTLTPVRSSRGAPTSRTINGIAVSTTAATFSADSGLGLWGSMDGYATAVNGGWQGTMFTYSADIDMSGKFFSVEFMIALVNSFNTEGLIVVFEDNGGTNWKAYQLSQIFGMLSNQLYTGIIDLTNSTPYDSGGTLDLTQVRKISFLAHRLANTTSRTFLIRHLNLLSKTTLTGGNATKPLTPNYLRKVLQGWSCAGLVGGESPAITVKSDVQIGDGTIPTYLDATGTLTTFPPAYNSLSQREWNVGANQIDVTIKAGASDTINLTATSVSADQQQNLTFDAATDASAAYSTSGASIIGMLPTWQSVTPANNVTHSGCGIVAFGGCTATNVTVTRGTGQCAATVSDGFDDTGGTYVGNSTCIYGLRVAVAGDIYLDNSTFSGFTKDIDVTAVSGAVDIHLATGTATPTYQTAGATVTIIAPQPILDATVLANTRAVLYNRTADAEISNTLVAGTSWTHTVTSGASSGDVLDLYTFKEGYQESVATIIYTGANASFAVQQATDPAIQYYRTQESITDYTTLTEYNFYSPDIYIQADDADGENTLKKLFIFYNGVLTTEDGARYMRGGVTFRSAFDVVINRSVVAMAVDNVSVTHGLHFTDEDVIRVTTDDGTSWIAPPSAPGSIRYAFGVSPGQVETTGSSVVTGTAQSIIDAIPTTNDIWSNNKALTVPKFLGLK